MNDDNDDNNDDSNRSAIIESIRIIEGEVRGRARRREERRGGGSVDETMVDHHKDAVMAVVGEEEDEEKEEEDDDDDEKKKGKEEKKEEGKKEKEEESEQEKEEGAKREKEEEEVHTAWEWRICGRRFASPRRVHVEHRMATRLQRVWRGFWSREERDDEAYDPEAQRGRFADLAQVNKKIVHQQF